jgi:hypothetical protein
MKKTESILPQSLASEIKHNPRDALKEQLKQKINQLKNDKNRPSEQLKKKLEKDAKKEKKEVDNDPRVTYKMKHLFITALRTYPGMDLANPHEILEKKEEYTLDYYNFCIKLLKDNNNDQNMLKNPYCEYMKEVLEIN